MKCWILMLAVFGIFVSTVVRADESSATPSAPSTETVTQDRLDILSHRLDAIERKESDILNALADIKAELEIVKIRATLKT